jgi:hypothetical protein
VTKGWNIGNNEKGKRAEKDWIPDDDNGGAIFHFACPPNNISCNENKESSGGGSSCHGGGGNDGGCKKKKKKKKNHTLLIAHGFFSGIPFGGGLFGEMNCDGAYDLDDEGGEEEEEGRLHAYNTIESCAAASETASEISESSIPREHKKESERDYPTGKPSGNFITSFLIDPPGATEPASERSEIESSIPKKKECFVGRTRTELENDPRANHFITRFFSSTGQSDTTTGAWLTGTGPVASSPGSTGGMSPTYPHTWTSLLRQSMSIVGG